MAHSSFALRVRYRPLSYWPGRPPPARGCDQREPEDPPSTIKANDSWVEVSYCPDVERSQGRLRNLAWYFLVWTFVGLFFLSQDLARKFVSQEPTPGRTI